MNDGAREITTTYLEMLSSEALKPKESGDENFWVREAVVPQWEFNRFLYQWVGRQWRWTDKLDWDESRWRQYAEDPRLRTFAAFFQGSPAGYYELHQSAEEGTEIAYFGLGPAFCGRGLGGVLLTSALREAWKKEPRRIWVHTCTDDHPSALANYLARGMTIYRTEHHLAPARSA
jgi:GNAT superfamily N-acetyltransferase